jgi:hypothetical protein
MTTRTKAPSVTWRGEHCTAHAYPSRGRGPAACGEAWTDERFARPTERQCLACRAALGLT